MKSLMPSSLQLAIGKLHRLCTEGLENRFDLALKAIRIHQDKYGFIPHEWEDFLFTVKQHLNSLSNPTKEEFMSNLIDLQVRRLVWITKILHSDLDYTHEELIELSTTELRDLVDEAEPITVTEVRGTCTGKSTITHVVKKAA